MGACSSFSGEQYSMGAYKIQVQKQIAEGGFSFIFQCRDQKGNTLCLKKIPAQDEEKLSNANIEVKMFKLVKEEKGFLPLLAHTTVTHRDRQIFLLFPLLPTSLFHHVLFPSESKENRASERNPRPLSEPKSLALTRAVASALLILHNLGFVHGDVKPQNILLTSDLQPLVCDMASCRPVRRMPKTRAEGLEIQEDADLFSTPSYRAPELHDVKTREEINGKIDVFALGCTLYFCLTGRNPYDHPQEGFIKLALMQGKLPDGLDCGKKTRKVVAAMLKANPRKRLSMEKVIENCSSR